MHHALQTLLAHIVQAQNEQDADLFISLFDKNLQNTINRDSIIQMQSDLYAEFGRMLTPTPLAHWQKESNPWLLYHVRFDKSPNDFLLSILLNGEPGIAQALAIHIS